jgi:hypothetical protein
MELKTRLTHLSLLNDQSSAPYFHHLVASLQEFTNLNSLKINAHTNACIYSFDKYIEMLPLLESLSKKLYPVGEYVAGRTRVVFIMEQDDHSINIDISKINPRPVIKQFDGKFVAYTDESIKYFMHSFSGLNKLQLNTGKMDNKDFLKRFADNKKTLTPDIMSQFIEYAGCIPSFNIENLGLNSPVTNLAKYM